MAKCQTTTATDFHPMVLLPPPHLQIPPIPPIINNNPSLYGAPFRREDSHTSHQSTDNPAGHIRLYHSNVKLTMVQFLMRTEPNSPEGYVSYGSLFIPWLTGYLHNYIGCFLCQHGYIILELLHIALLKLLETQIQAHLVIQSFQILNMLNFANLALILRQTHDVPVNMHFLKNLLKVKLLKIRYLHHH